MKKRELDPNIELLESITMIIPITPMGAVRTTRGMINLIKSKNYDPDNKKVQRVIAYLQYKEMIGLLARSNMGPKKMFTGPVYTDIQFFMPMPASWSVKKRLNSDGEFHLNTPDRDNLEKGVFDAMNKIVWQDDRRLPCGYSIKRYSFDPRIEITVSEVRLV